MCAVCIGKNNGILQNEEIESICIGYAIKKQYWNKEITTDTTKALIISLRFDLTVFFLIIILLTL